MSKIERTSTCQLQIGAHGEQRFFAFYSKCWVNAANKDRYLLPLLDAIYPVQVICNTCGRDVLGLKVQGNIVVATLGFNLLKNKYLPTTALRILFSPHILEHFPGCHD